MICIDVAKQLVQERAAGNPKFIEELLAQMKKDKLFVVEEGAVKLLRSDFQQV